MSPVTILDGEDEVRAAVGRALGITDWIEITAERMDQFVRATGDGEATYFAISLSNMFLPQIVEVRGFAMGINYGTDAVSFNAPINVGAKVRAAAVLDDVVEVRGGIQTRMQIVIESGVGDPMCVINSISRWLH